MQYQHGGDVYGNPGVVDFSANINPLSTPDTVLAAAREGVAGMADYPDYACRRLRGKLADEYGVALEHVICGNGAAELIYLFAQVCKPKKALVVVPSFAEYEAALCAAGCVPCYHILREDEGFQLTDRILGDISGDLELLCICSPNNPTGCLADRGLLCQIAGRCRELNIHMLLDECFMDFTETAEQYSMASSLLEYPELFLLKSFTKMYRMAGLRLGYGLCADRKLLECMEECRQPWSVSMPAQLAGIAALGEKEFVRDTRQYILVEREYLEREMRNLGFKVYSGTANFILFRAEKNLVSMLLRQGILIRDCSNFVGLEEGYYRVSVRRHEDNRRLIEAFAEFA